MFFAGDNSWREIAAIRRGLQKQKARVWFRRSIIQFFYARDEEIVVDRRPHEIEKAKRVGQLCMQLESRFVAPTRVDVEQQRVACRTEIFDSETAGLRAHL